MSYRLQCTDSAGLTLVSNIIHKNKCKNEHNDKKCETCGITYEVCYCFLVTKVINKSLMKS